MLKKSIYLVVASFIILLSGCSEKEEVQLITTDNISLLTDRSINSTVLNQTMKYNILLPNDYYTNSGRYYPILYLLHGMGGDNNSWAVDGNVKQIVQDAITNKVVSPIIVVMPDAFNTFYVNGYQNGLMYESYFWDEFLPYIEQNYRVNAIRENRFIAGLSMGGFGASYYAFTYPGKFIYSYSMSGAVAGIGSASVPSVSSIVSEYPDFDSLPEYTMDCGTYDPLVFEANESEHESLVNMGFEHEYMTREGTHDWVFWKRSLEMALERIGTYIE